SRSPPTAPAIPPVSRTRPTTASAPSSCRCASRGGEPHAQLAQRRHGRRPPPPPGRRPPTPQPGAARGERPPEGRANRSRQPRRRARVRARAAPPGARPRARRERAPPRIRLPATEPAMSADTHPLPVEARLTSAVAATRTAYAVLQTHLPLFEQLER